ncbi:putative Ig domain-containing protein [Enterovibrio paralichthyis]|uniref:putative Ig domain-containing protein n=1 Tax=Enterovibrio paralichthyis TaxID=2853805 RepID=UPI001C47E58C|nr:putative Ig domain-containing protein [Enterovibrio paralichthyis]MBV7299148.1 choice-of-anchor A family protein [Enterovibrio paralichthyis]
MKYIFSVVALFFAFNIAYANANILREAGSFSAFIFEDFEAPSGDSDGPLYIGQNLKVNGYSIGDGLPPETDGYILFVGGDVTFPVGRLYYGDALVSGSVDGIGSSVLDGLSTEQSIDTGNLPLSIDEQRAYLTNLSTRMASHPANGAVLFQWGGLYMEGDGSSNWQVFDLDSESVSKAHTFSVKNIPDGATVVFNIKGAEANLTTEPKSVEASLTNKSLADLIPHRNRTIFNFVDATKIRLAGVAIEGTVLAPHAHLDAPHGDAHGTLIAKSFYGAMHLGFNRFEGDLSFLNRAPEIVSSAPNSVNERELYIYDAQAIDEDNDPLTWSILRGPQNLSVDPTSGKVTWNPDSDLADSLKGINGYCSIPQEPTKQVQGSADILIAMDESGSMRGEQQWLSGIMPTLESLLLERGVGAQSDKNLYGSVGFGYGGANLPASLRKITTNGKELVNAEEFPAITAQYIASGGFEDGWSAINLMLADYPIRENTAKNVIVVTDEDRDNGNSSITFDSLKTDLLANSAVLNVVVNGGFICEDGRQALGVDANGNGYVAEDNGNFSICSGAKHNGRADGATNAHYIKLALETGGAAWDLNYLRRGGVYAQAFSKAFVEIKVREIINQLPPIPQSDVIVQQISLPHDAADLAQLDIPVTLLNRGLADISSSASIALFEVLANGTTRVISSTTTDLNLPSEATQTLWFSGVTLSENALSLGASVTLGDSTSECLIDNNQTLRTLVSLQVADDWGGVDTQLFEIGVNNVNDPPTAEVTALEQEINAGTEVTIELQVNDPDLGDQLEYSLVGAPFGVKVDKRSGKIVWDTSDVEPGTYVFTIVVTDLAGNQVEITVTVTVKKEPNLPPDITSIPGYQATQVTPYAYQVVATDPNTNDNVIYSTSVGTIDGMTGDLVFSASETTPGWQSPEICQMPATSTADFNPIVKWHWSGGNQMPEYNQVLGAPIVVQLNDDNGDGSINGFDHPDVVVAAFKNSSFNSPGVIQALSGVDGTEIWSVSTTGPLADPWHGVAAADIDGDGLVEIATGFLNGELGLYENDGTLKWRVSAGGKGQITISDLEGDGSPEIIYAGGVYDNQGSKLFSINASTIPIAFDSNGDGTQEILSGGNLYDSVGNVLWTGPSMEFAGVADFDGDLSPEIVVVGANQISLMNADGTFAWGPIAIEGSGGGAPTIADVDGDGKPEITLAAKSFYFVFEDDGSVKWKKVTQDISSAKTGSTVFDFDGDGKAEILYSDELYFRVFDGITGDTLYELPNPSATWVEYPVVADVDNDLQAEIVLVSNNFRWPGSTGVRVLEGANWAPTRSIWNQHAYHIDNINDDGSVPSVPAESWLSHNTYRLNTFADRALTALSDLKISDVNYLDGVLNLTVENGGEAKSQDGLTVTLLDNQTSAVIRTWSIPDLDINGQFSISDIVDLSTFESVTLIIDDAGYETECNRFNNRTRFDLITVTATDLEGASDYQQFSVRTEPLNIAPVATQPESVELVTNQSLVLTLAASDANAWDVVTWRAIGLPSDAIFDGVSGTFKWKPSSLDIGAHSFVFEAVDTYGASSQVTLDVVVVQENQAPTISSMPTLSAIEDTEWQYQIVATDPDGDTLAYEVMFPSSITVDSAGLVTWLTPVVGVHSVALRVSDGRGGFAEQSFQLTVEATPDSIPVITSLPELTVEQGNSYRYQVIANDADGDTLTYTLTQYPVGMVVSSSGLIEWAVPSNAAEGNYPVEVTVSDGQSAATQAFNVAVTTSTQTSPPTITSTPMTSAVKGDIYQYQVVASDADGDALTYSLSNSPAGMAITSSGLVQWAVPADLSDGSYAVQVVVSDGKYDLTQAFDILVNASGQNSPPTITSTPMTSAAKGDTYQYQVVASDADGETLTYSLANSPAGMAITSSGLVQWAVPANLSDGSYTVEVVVSDSQYAVSQTFSIFVGSSTTNEAPIITSVPNAAAIAGQQYRYQVLASDPDGDALSFSLNQSPAGMVINQSGLVEWAVPQSFAGNAPVEIIVSDGKAQTKQSFGILVNSAGGNQPPVFTSQPVTQAVIGEFYDSPMPASDPEGDALSFTLLEAPQGMSVDANGNVSWQVPLTASSSVSVTLEVSDGVNFVRRTWNVTISEWLLPLDLGIGVSAGSLEVNQSALVQAQPSGGKPPYQIVMTANGNPLSLDSQLAAEVLASAPSLIKLVATVVDSKGTSVTTTETISVITGTDVAAPTVSIDTPINGSEISSLTDVVGTVLDDNLAKYVLSAYPIDVPAERQVLAEGFNNVIGTLAEFDPTMLNNGAYTIVIEAEDVDGNRSAASTDVIVTGDMKVGNFSITQRDVDIPMMSIPLTLDRTYDSRNKSQQGDFGYGWSLGLTDVRVDESEVIGMYWSLNHYPNSNILFSKYCIEPTGDTPEVTVTLPDGDVERFEVELIPACNAIVPKTDVTLSFKAIGDTQSTLEPLENKQLRFQGGQLYDWSSLIDIADPDRYALVLRNGTRIEIDQLEGLEKIVSPTGQHVQFTRDGIIHSEGKSVVYNRDAKGRIEQVVEPSGATTQYKYDVLGNLRAVTDPLGNTTTFEYNRNHGLLNINDPLGRRLVRNIYDDSGRLIAQEDEQGNRTEFSHDIAGKQSTVVDRNGNTRFYYYDDNGNVTTEVDALGNTTQHTYDANGNKLSTTDALGNMTRATFNADGDQLSYTNGEGNRTEFVYNELGLETDIIDTLGNRHVNAYDSVGNLMSTTDPRGNTESYTYDFKGNHIETTDPLGQVTTYAYDADGNKIVETSPMGTVKRYEYDSSNRVTREVTEKVLGGVTQEAVTTYVYDAKGNTVEMTDSLGNSTFSVFDPLDQLVESTDAQGNTTFFEYDGYGREIAVVHPDGTRTEKSYDAEGNVISETDAMGRVTTFEYDAVNRQIARVTPEGGRFETEFDAAGRIYAEVDALGNRTVYIYDPANRRIGTVDAAGNVTKSEYDSEGNVFATIDASGNRTEYEYDALGNKTLTRYADGTTEQAFYDALGRQTEIVDQAGNKTHYEYDGDGRLVAVVDAQLHRTEYRYDEMGNRTAQVDALGRETAWTYDLVGNMLSRTLPMGQTETFTYNTLNQLETHVDFNGLLTTYTYDAVGRMVSESVGLGTTKEQIITHQYDAAGKTVLTSVENQAGTETWTYQYDLLGQLITEQQPSGDVLSYTYDVNGNKTSLTVDSKGVSETTLYEYDSLNRLAMVIDNQGATTRYTYTSTGHNEVTYHPNGTSTHHFYDDLYRLVEMYTQSSDGSKLTHFVYTLSPTGLRLSVEERHINRVVSYQYDSLNRMLQESHKESDGSELVIAHEYGPTGNRLKEIRNGVETVFTYDANDRLLTKDGATYIYDDNGSLLSESVVGGETTTYSYDGKNRLALVKAGLDSIEHGYNPEGIRTLSVRNGASTHYVVDSNRQYAQVVREHGLINKSYVYGLDLLSYQENSDRYFFVYDGLGSTRALTDIAGVVTDKYDYEGYGTVLNREGSSSNSYLYTGEQFDASLGKYYLRARYYDQSTGRFTQQDTWLGNNQEPITLNKYLYGNASPANFIDPTGHMSMMSLNISMSTRGALSSVAVPNYSGALLKVLSATVQVSGRITSRALVRKLVRDRTRGKLPFNLLVVGFDSPDMIAHVSKAQASIPGSVMLRYDRSVGGAKGGRRWYTRMGGLPGCMGRTPSGMSCDEYPMYKTTRGGYSMYSLGLVSLKWVNAAQNSYVGVHFGVLSRYMRRDKNFVVATSPLLPTMALPKR